jgi:hypothetical protein
VARALISDAAHPAFNSRKGNKTSLSLDVLGPITTVVRGVVLRYLSTSYVCYAGLPFLT